MSQMSRGSPCEVRGGQDEVGGTDSKGKVRNRPPGGWLGRDGGGASRLAGRGGAGESTPEGQRARGGQEAGVEASRKRVQPAVCDATKIPPPHIAHVTAHVQNVAEKQALKNTA